MSGVAACSLYEGDPWEGCEDVAQWDLADFLSCQPQMQDATNTNEIPGTSCSTQSRGEDAMPCLASSPAVSSSLGIGSWFGWIWSAPSSNEHACRLDVDDSVVVPGVDSDFGTDIDETAADEEPIEDHWEDDEFVHRSLLDEYALSSWSALAFERLQQMALSTTHADQPQTQRAHADDHCMAPMVSARMSNNFLSLFIFWLGSLIGVKA